MHPTAGRRQRGASAAQKLARTQAAKADLHLHFFIAVSLLRPATRRTKPRRWYMMQQETKKYTTALFKLQVFSLSFYRIKSLDTCMEY